MSKIRKVTIQNFRGIENFEWFPRPTINCLIGHGDVGKSTILDAIDLCLGARRNIRFTDGDFYNLDVTKNILIEVVLGDLEDELLSFDAYGVFLRGLHRTEKRIEDEIGSGLESVLCVRLEVEGDLEPQWSLYSERAVDQGVTRNLRWGDRVRLAPTRIGLSSDYNLSWRHGSVLNRASDERLQSSNALAEAARKAREVFGDEAEEQFEKTLVIVKEAARDLGVPVGEEVKALLDAHSISFGGGAVSLHDEDGLPLSGLGLGSSRLLTAGIIQRSPNFKAATLIDEVEQGLEPHRIMRLVDALRSESKRALQVFVTTHSPIVIRELSAEDLYLIRKEGGHRTALHVGLNGDFQAVVRSHAEALLALKLIVCEGKTEMGLVRGLDEYAHENGGMALKAQGVALVDGNGSNTFDAATNLYHLGFPTAVFCDSDVDYEQEKSSAREAGIAVFDCDEGLAVEDELFQNLSDESVENLLDLAVEFWSEELIDAHIKSASENNLDLASVKAACFLGLEDAHRDALSRASQAKKNSWFKSVSRMQRVAYEVVGPAMFQNSNLFPHFGEVFLWAKDA